MPPSDERSGFLLMRICHRPVEDLTHDISRVEALDTLGHHVVSDNPSFVGDMTRRSRQGGRLLRRRTGDAAALRRSLPHMPAGQQVYISAGHPESGGR